MFLRVRLSLSLIHSFIHSFILSPSFTLAFLQYVTNHFYRADFHSITVPQDPSELRVRSACSTTIHFSFAYDMREIYMPEQPSSL